MRSIALSIWQVAGGFVSSLARSVGTHVSALNQPSLIGATWDENEATRRLEASIAFEDEWLTRRAVAQQAAVAAAAAVGSEAAAAVAPEQDNGAPARRSKRARGAVDYGALEVELQREDQCEGGAASGAADEGADAGAAGAKRPKAEEGE